MGNDQSPTTYDGVSPLLTVEPPQFIVGSTVSADWKACGPSDPPDRTYNGATIRLRWDGQDATSGARSYDISSENADGEVRLLQEATGATTYDIGGTTYDNNCGGGFHTSHWWVTARDWRGNTATSPGASDHLEIFDETGVNPHETTTTMTVQRTGTWSTSTCTCHTGGKTTFTSARSASIAYTFTIDKPGRTVAVVAPTGSTRGVMNISVDGGASTAVDTYTTGANVNRVVVWQQAFNTSGLHTIRIVNAASAGRPRIDVDAIMIGPTWEGEGPYYYG